ncbi:MAG TPA: prepilin-type N-terminal cleavage/methylation domain-containing protein [Longimicrobium sp.]|nr:prepilin-type N-terminal cleavage/methylation domain-containing protein [Longimicrobium sp.]
METGILTRRANAGFTLVEVMVSMVILAIVLVGFQAAATRRLLGDLQLQDTRNAAVQLAADRLRVVQLDPVYNELYARYAGTETSIAGYTGYKRVTTVVQTLSNGNDFTTVTVRVTPAGPVAPVQRSLVIAAP